MSHNIKVTLPHEFNPEKRAYFYQSLSALNYYLLPGTTIQLQVKDSSEDESDLYYLEICFNNTIVKTSVESKDYHFAVKKMMNSLLNKFSEILQLVNKSSKKEEAKPKDENDADDEDKIIH